MKNHQVSWHRLFVWLIVTTCIILTTTTKYLHGTDIISCEGNVGVGFPVSFLCDWNSGGSPIDSWGKVDSADFPYFSLEGLLIDVPFYLLILFSVAWAVHLYYGKDLHQFELYKQMYIITITFAIGFLLASFIIDANQEDLYAAWRSFDNSRESVPAPDFKFPGLLIGSLLGLTISFGIAWAVHYIYRNVPPLFEPYKHRMLITVALAIGFLFAILIIDANHENFQDYINRPPIPTIVPSPTTVPSPSPFETVFPGITPIATPTH